MLSEHTAAEWSRRLAAGDVSSVELTRACLERIERHDAAIGAFLSVSAETALRQAESVDRRRGAGDRLGPLAGLPVAVKDMLCARDEPTTCASRYLADYRPPYDATVVRLLRDADAVLLGKTNMDEFAMGGSGENSAFHETRNPWDPQRVPGGSSSGSAACVAADMAPLAVGTDTGGSIRQPAAFCGVAGLKPTYGRVSRYGLVAFASSLDQAGPMGRSAADLALLLQAIAGHDPLDSTSVPQPPPDYLEAARAPDQDRPLAGVRLGRVGEHFQAAAGGAEAVARVDEALAVFEQLGARVVDVELPHSKYAIAAYYIIAPSEASSNLSRYDGMHYGRRADIAEARAAAQQQRQQGQAEDSLLQHTYALSRSQGLGPEVQRRVMLGAYALSAGYYDKYYVKALQVRRLIRQDYDAAFREVDALIGPVTPTPAFKLGEKTDDPLAMYLGDLFTVGANLAGIPALSVPCGLTDEGLPVGLHLQAPLMEESRLLRLAAVWQQATDWHLRRPPL